MVLLIIIPIFYGYFIGNIPNIFRHTHHVVLNHRHRSVLVDFSGHSAEHHRFPFLDHPGDWEWCHPDWESNETDEALKGGMGINRFARFIPFNSKYVHGFP